MVDSHPPEHPSDLMSALHNVTDDRTTLRQRLQDVQRKLDSTLAIMKDLQKLLRGAAGKEPLPPEPPATANRRPWLAIAIPTVPRPVSYLQQSLESLIAQLPTDPGDPLYGQVVVVIMNQRPGSHPAFEEAKKAFASHALAPFLEFVDNPGENPDPNPNKRDPGNANMPGHIVRGQTRDVASLMQFVGDRAAYYLFGEDDFIFCPHAVLAIRYIIDKTTKYHSKFAAVRFSFGLNGIVIHGEDVATLAAYLLEHQERRPPDHLLSEWMGKETDQSRKHLNGRVNGAFRYNILDHIGVKSSIRPEDSPPYPRCYEELGFPTLFTVEAFDPAKCPDDDIWPCEPADRTQPRLAWGALAAEVKARQGQQGP